MRDVSRLPYTIEQKPHGLGRWLGILLAWVAAVVLGAAALMLGASSPAAAAPPAPASCSTGDLLGDTSSVDAVESKAQQDFLGRLNGLRASKGLGALAWNSAMTKPSIEWSQTMSVQVPPGGSSAGWLHHARDTGAGDGVEPWQDYVTINSAIVKNWQRLAENVGVSTMRSACSMTDLEASAGKAVEGLHNAFVNSSGHYKNMVGDHNQVGIGVHIDATKMWVTVRFAKGDLPAASSSASTVMTSETGKYIDAVYQLFGGRSATAGEKQWWTPSVQSGDRRALTSALSVTDAWAGVRVNDLYEKILGRSADGGGRAYWLDAIARGLRLESVAVEFYSSKEYYWRNGATNRSWVAALYRDLMERNADSAGLSYWVAQTDQGRLSRSGVANSFYGSIESRRDRSGRLYVEIIGSPLRDPYLQSWADRLIWVGDVGLAADLAASRSYWSLTTG